MRVLDVLTRGYPLSIDAYTAPILGYRYPPTSLPSVDYLLFLDINPLSTPSVITSRHLQSDGETGRPIVGECTLSLPGVVLDPSRYAVYAGMVHRAFIQLLAFKPSLFSQYRLPTDLLTPVNQSAFFLTLPPRIVVRDTVSNEVSIVNATGPGSVTLTDTLVQIGSIPAYTYWRGEPALGAVRGHTGNMTIPGVLLDPLTQTANSSLHRALYVEDVLKGTDELPLKVSNITLMMMQSTGWYVVDPTLYMPTYAGKNIKQFQADINLGCLSSDDPLYCSVEGEIGCSPDGHYKTICKTDTTTGCKYKAYSSSCTIPPIDYIRTVGSEYIGNSSRCTLTTPSSADPTQSVSCLQSLCSSTTLYPAYTLSDGTVCPPCTVNGYMQCSPSDIRVYCDVRVCALSTVCPNDCSGRGECTVSGCFCYYGWEGKDCADKSTTEIDYQYLPLGTTVQSRGMSVVANVLKIIGIVMIIVVGLK